MMLRSIIRWTVRAIVHEVVEALQAELPRRGLSHKDVQHQQEQIRRGVSHGTVPRKEFVDFPEPDPFKTEDNSR